MNSIAQGTGTTTVTVTVNAAELHEATDLGLWLQIKPDEGSDPIVVELPEAYRWSYIPKMQKAGSREVR